MAVHYKFKSAKGYDTITFEGGFISLGDLKRSIVEQKKLGKLTDFDLRIENAQTQDEFEKETDLVPKNTSVIVRRVPRTRPLVEEETGPVAAYVPLLSDGGAGVSSAIGAAAGSGEASAIASLSGPVQNWSKTKRLRTQYPAHKTRPTGGVPPPHYICRRCKQGGHFITDCPTNGDPRFDVHRAKAASGIPTTFLKPVENLEAGEHALMMPGGGLAVYQPQENDMFKNLSTTDTVKLEGFPEELRCLLCKGLLNQAVTIPCCNNTFCDECIQRELFNSADLACPICGEAGTSLDSLHANDELREKVTRFQEEKRREGQLGTSSDHPIPEPQTAQTAAAQASSNARHDAPHGSSHLTTKREARRGSRSPATHRGSRSPFARRGSRSPVAHRESHSPLHSRRLSPARGPSPPPQVRRRSPPPRFSSPNYRRSPPPRRFSPSRHRFSPPPLPRRLSPARRRSPVPLSRYATERQRRSPLPSSHRSPVRSSSRYRRSPSPPPRRAPLSPRRHGYSRSPVRPRSPVRDRSRSPMRSRHPSPSPQRRRSRHASPSPQRSHPSPSPKRHPSPSPQRSRHPSPSPQRRSRHPSPSPQRSHRPSPAPQGRSGSESSLARMDVGADLDSPAPTRVLSVRKRPERSPSPQLDRKRSRADETGTVVDSSSSSGGSSRSEKRSRKSRKRGGNKKRSSSSSSKSASSSSSSSSSSANRESSSSSSKRKSSSTQMESSQSSSSTGGSSSSSKRSSRKKKRSGRKDRRGGGGGSGSTASASNGTRRVAATNGKSIRIVVTK